jgi:hypothetical protein
VSVANQSSPVNYGVSSKPVFAGEFYVRSKLVFDVESYGSSELVFIIEFHVISELVFIAELCMSPANQFYCRNLCNQ